MITRHQHPTHKNVLTALDVSDFTHKNVLTALDVSDQSSSTFHKQNEFRSELRRERNNDRFVPTTNDLAPVAQDI
jgi:hypothetical protein